MCSQLAKITRSFLLCPGIYIKVRLTRPILLMVAAILCLAALAMAETEPKPAANCEADVLVSEVTIQL